MYNVTISLENKKQFNMSPFLQFDDNLCVMAGGKYNSFCSFTVRCFNLSIQDVLYFMYIKSVTLTRLRIRSSKMKRRHSVIVVVARFIGQVEHF